jgi:luciferase family oxidoreductase group 1
VVIPFSVLDLAPVGQGSDSAQALRNSLDLARHAERLGFHRYWLAEHHNMPGIASAATSVVIGHVAAGTSRIRVGAGGIMLPNHAPLVIAEQFGTLDALFPGRIDLGIGRAPGTDQLTARALRRTLNGDVDSFPDDVVELLGYFRADAVQQPVRAIPGAGARLEVWMLGSSLFGAQLAASMGLPYAFASHFAPSQLDHALTLYRARFRPSPAHPRPHVMVAANVIVADTDEEAQLLLTSLQQAFVALRSGRPGLLPPPLPGFEASLAPDERALLDHVLSCSFVGAPETVRRGLEGFLARTRPDELMVTAQVHDHAARVRSFERVAALRERW